MKSTIEYLRRIEDLERAIRQFVQTVQTVGDVVWPGEIDAEFLRLAQTVGITLETAPLQTVQTEEHVTIREAKSLGASQTDRPIRIKMCKNGCGERVTGKGDYCSNACRQNAYYKRKNRNNRNK